ncbi:hypothetical protein Golomagni_05245 [Golovinomyces magnicellulatus]|nr:hypothetical protein Golomagni_05245 [Golovinomyces magnicellulatus]
MSTLPPVYILDGGLGTTLADQFGCVFDDSTPLWSSHLLLSATGTQILQKCHTAFVDAGASLVTTATYQASTREFMEFPLEAIEIEKFEIERETRVPVEAVDGFDRSTTRQSRIHPEGKSEKGVISHKRLLAHKHMRNAVKLARSSFGAKKGTVVLGLGAAGACLKPSQEYTGNYVGSEVGTSVSSIRQWHLERIRVFATRDFQDDVNEEFSTNECWNEVDLIAFETLPLLTEIIAVREAMAEINDEKDKYSEKKMIERKDFWISCVFPGESYCLPDGSSITMVVKAMLEKRDGAETPMAIGINCTRIGKLETLIERFENALVGMVSDGEIEKWPSLIVYPDGTNGEVFNTLTHQWEMKEDPNLEFSSLTYIISQRPWDEIMYGIISRARYRGAWNSIYAGGCCKISPKDIKNLSSRWNSA